MKKTLLAVSIMALFAVNVNAASKLPEDDLQSIDDILNDKQTSSTPKSTDDDEDAFKPSSKSKPTTKHEERKAVEKTKNSKPGVAPSKTPSSIKPKDAAVVAPQVIINGDTPDQRQNPDYVPKLLVPVAHKELNFTLTYKQKNIFEKKIDETELNLSFADKVSEANQNEPVIKGVVDRYNNGKVASLKSMTVEPDVLTGVNVSIVEGKEVRKNKIENINYGYNYIVQIKEVDIKNSRVKYRIDYSRSNIKSYNEVDMILETGETRTVKIPQIVQLDVSKEFYMPLKNGETTNIRIDNSNSIDFTLNKVNTYVDTVAIEDKKAIEARRIAKVEAEKAEAEQKITDEKKKDTDMFESLEDKLK